MKKIYLFVLAAAGILAVASCAREEFIAPEENTAPGEHTTLTISLDATKTALVDGKTTWVAGDKVRILNSTGTFSEDFEVPEELIGSDSFPVEVSMKDTAYFAVYPVKAAVGVSGGKAQIKLPSDPDGLFSSANICVGAIHYKKDTTSFKAGALKLKNVTALFKVKVQSNNVVEILQFSSKNNMVGTYNVDFSGETPALVAASATKSATIAVGGVDAEYYIPVAPGSYEEGFTVTALKGNGGLESLKTKKANDVKINTIVDMGVIGTNISNGLSGEGTEADPFLISSDAEFLGFSSAVNLGNSFEGKYVKLNTDVTKVETSVGYYVSSDVQYPMSAHFLGENHTITLAIDGTNVEKSNSTSYVGLFGLLGEGSSVKDLKIAGSVSTTGQFVGGLAGYTRGSNDKKVEISNIESTATVTGGISVGGIIGHSYYTTISNVVNNGAVTGTGNNGTFFYMTYSGSSNVAYNKGTSVMGTGGVVGVTQNSTLASCENKASVTALNKAGGVVGMLFWSSMEGCKNSGAISASATESLAGGICGYSHCSGSIKNCENSGTVSGVTVVGGICGYATGTYYGHPNAFKLVIEKCHNKATGMVTATQGVVGGICGVQVATQNPSIANVIDCVNDADVSTPGRKAGGITAVMADCTGWGSIEINRCENNGKVSAAVFAGGAVAYVTNSGDYWKPTFSEKYGVTTPKWHVYNTVNNGTVMGTRSDDYGEVAGGIVGGMFATGSANANNLGLWISNCLNTGDVLYKVGTHVKPYCGGIIGKYLRGRIYNVCNTGRVGPETGDPAAGAEATLGGVVGNFDDNAKRFCAFQQTYFLDSSCGQLMGTGAKTTANTANMANNLSFDGTGLLNGQVTYNSQTYTQCVDALNAWAVKAGTSYLTWSWTTGPVLGQ